MSYKVNYSPLLCARTPPPQPCHKKCDVAHSSTMKGQTLHCKADSAVLCGSDPPDDSVPALKAHLWPDGAEETLGMERLLRKCRIRSQLVRECMAECLGVYVLIVSISCVDLNLLHEARWCRLREVFCGVRLSKSSKGPFKSVSTLSVLSRCSLFHLFCYAVKYRNQIFLPNSHLISKFNIKYLTKFPKKKMHAYSLVLKLVNPDNK